MIALELEVGDKFFIDSHGYRQMVFELLDVDDERGLISAKTDLTGWPEQNVRLAANTPVLRVFDVEPIINWTIVILCCGLNQTKTSNFY